MWQQFPQLGCSRQAGLPLPPSHPKAWLIRKGKKFEPKKAEKRQTPVEKSELSRLYKALEQYSRRHCGMTATFSQPDKQHFGEHNVR